MIYTNLVVIVSERSVRAWQSPCRQGDCFAALAMTITTDVVPTIYALGKRLRS